MIRESKNNYIHGDHNFICDKSGFKGKFSEMRREWTGLWVLRRFWEPRHPQDMLKAKKDQPGVDVARPPPDTRTFLSDNEVTIDGY
jgi:hypothetical protein